MRGRVEVIFVALAVCAVGLTSCAHRPARAAARVVSPRVTAAASTAPPPAAADEATPRGRQRMDDAPVGLSRSRDAARTTVDVPPAASSMGAHPGAATGTAGTVGSTGTAVVTEAPSYRRGDPTLRSWSISQIPRPTSGGHTLAILLIVSIGALVAMSVWIYGRRRG